MTNASPVIGTSEYISVVRSCVSFWYGIGSFTARKKREKSPCVHPHQSSTKRLGTNPTGANIILYRHSYCDVANAIKLATSQKWIKQPFLNWQLAKFLSHSQSLQSEEILNVFKLISMYLGIFQWQQVLHRLCTCISLQKSLNSNNIIPTMFVLFQNLFLEVWIS